MNQVRSADASLSAATGPLARLALVCLAMLVVYLDVSIAPVALPAIRADLHADVTATQWVLDAYNLAFASLLLSAGSLGDRLGRATVLLVGTAGFMLCSVGCALAPSIGFLIAARAGQGVFAAAIVPLSLAVTSDLYTNPRQKVRAIAVWASVAGVALALGPLVGGLLVQSAGWRSLFWINVPIGVVAFGGLVALLARPAADRGRRIDVLGQLLFVAGGGGLTFVLIEAARYGWGAPIIVLPLVGAVGCLALFGWWQSRAPAPMLPPRLLRIPLVVVACAVNFLGLFGVYAVLFLLTVYLQGTVHLSPVATGMRFLALTGFLGLAAVTAPAVVERLGTRRTMLLGLGMAATGLAGLTLVEGGHGFASYGWALALLGFGTPLSGGVVAIQAMMRAVPPELAGTASGTMNTFRQFGAVLAVALAGILSPERAGVVTSMHVTFLVCAAGALVGALVTAIVLRERSGTSDAEAATRAGGGGAGGDDPVPSAAAARAAWDGAPGGGSAQDSPTAGGPSGGTVFDPIRS
jgi:DHA2 family methylenomycin A resistance protein-like MFS transporter